MNVRRKNGEYEPATFSSFQRNIQRYLSEIKNTFNILKDNEFEKSGSHLFSGTTEKTNCKPFRRLTNTKKRPKNSATPIQLHFKELCGGFSSYTWVSEPEMRAMRTID